MHILEVLLVLAIVTLILCIIAMFIVINYNSIVEVLYKVNVSENKITETLKTKQDLLSRAINIIEKQLKIDTKVFDEFKKINSNNLKNNEKDLILSSTFNEVKKITEDYSELNEVKSYEGIIKDIEELDCLLGGIKTMNNKYVAIYNKYLRAFPKNIISKFKKFKSKSLYDITIKKEAEVII